jgi:hypothetical protein
MMEAISKGTEFSVACFFKNMGDAFVLCPPVDYGPNDDVERE